MVLSKVMSRHALWPYLPGGSMMVQSYAAARSAGMAPNLYSRNCFPRNLNRKKKKNGKTTKQHKFKREGPNATSLKCGRYACSWPWSTRWLPHLSFLLIYRWRLLLKFWLKCAPYQLMGLYSGQNCMEKTPKCKILNKVKISKIFGDAPPNLKGPLLDLPLGASCLVHGTSAHAFTLFAPGKSKFATSIFNLDTLGKVVKW